MTAAPRRRFDPTRDARRHVILFEPRTGRLYEVVAVRGYAAGSRQPPALALLDVGEDLPDDPFDELAIAPWVEATRVELMEVVPRA